MERSVTGRVVSGFFDVKEMQLVVSLECYFIMKMES